MPTELNLNFTDANHFVVRLGPDDEGSGQLEFTNPIGEKDLRDIQWYVETYGAHSLGDPDDDEAKRIAGQLPVWGKALFNAVFTEREAEQRGWTNLVAATRRILGGERDADTLCADVDYEDSMIVETILAGLADPSPLSDLLPSETSESA